MNTENALKKIYEITEKIIAYDHAIILLNWDFETEAPKMAVDKISETLSFFCKQSRLLLISDDMKNSLEILEKHVDELSYLDQRIIKKLRKDYNIATKIPVDEFAEYEKFLTKSQSVWKEAKQNNDFALFAPYLKKLIEYNKKFIEYREENKRPYDVLLNDYEPELTVEKADSFFEKLKKRIVPLLKKIQGCDTEIDMSFFDREFSIEKQKKLAEFFAEYIDFKFDKGVLKESEHPFTTNFDKNDVRITTHYYEKNILSSIYSVLHEGGHGIYEQGIDDEISKTLLGEGTSMGIHESQSRMYENIFGRSFEFWKPVYKKLIEVYPEFEELSLEEFYKCANKVEASLIRTDADELTYSLHIMIRYEMEKMLFEEEFDINELPKIWNKKYEEYLGITPKTDSEGILQDVHWASGLFGYFPSYALGNAYASQMVHQMRKDIDLDKYLAEGNFKEIREYLNEKIHNFGMSKTPQEIIVEMTNEELNPDYYCTYLENKFKKIYNL